MSHPQLLLLCEYATLNGGEQSLLATLPTVLEAGFEVAVALPPAGTLVAELQSRQIECLPYTLTDESGKRIDLPAARRRLAELLAKHRPSLVHANSLAMGRLAGPVLREINLPSVAHLRDIIGLRGQVVADLNCHRRLLAVSRATRDFHVTAGLDSDKMSVLYNGVDLDRFRPARSTGYLHRELGLPSEVQLVASIGQLGLRKDPLTFLQAARSVAELFHNVHFLLIGERFSGKQESLELERELHRLAEQVPLAGRVHFLGVRNDIATVLPELTLLVHVARQEPLGRVLLEAAATATAIIATDVGGTDEIFPPDAHAACLIPVGNVSALAQTMKELLADGVVRLTMGANARCRAEVMFDVRRRAAELVSVYRQVLESAAS